MRYIWLLALISLTVLLIQANHSLDTEVKRALVTPTPTTYIQPTLPPLVLDPYKIFNLVNDYRVDNGLKKLTWNETLCDFATRRLEEIHSDMSHDQFYVNQPCTNCDLGENLIKGFSTEEEVVHGWISSPSHLKQITSPVFDSTCIVTDYAFDQDPKASPTHNWFAVQEFAGF